MAHAICINHCYYGEHEFQRGDILNVGGGAIPPHFEAAKEEQCVGKRAFSAQKPRTTHPKPSATDRAQAGEAVALSEIAGSAAPVKDPVNFSDLI